MTNNLQEENNAALHGAPKLMLRSPCAIPHQRKEQARCPHLKPKIEHPQAGRGSGGGWRYDQERETAAVVTLWNGRQ
jgi:hypothetical protein